MKRILILAALLAGCSSANVSDVKAHARAIWAGAGFEIIGYEGYEIGRHYGPGLGGGQVWYTVRRVPDNGVTYHGFIEKWGDEYHIYNIRALDAVGPNP